MGASTLNLRLHPDDRMQLSVIICTRNRGALISATLKSAVAAGGELREVIVVDQSESCETAEAVAPFLADERLKLIRSSEVGLSNARNVGLGQARSEFILMTDDDCALPDKYAEHALQVFLRYSECSAVYFRVDAAPYDDTQGYTPVFLPLTERVLSGIHALKQASGIGAGLLLRRSAAESVGGFDPLLGAGGAFNSAEDVDLTIRLLLAGGKIAETNGLSVAHHGFRTNDELRLLVQRDWYGIGAAYAKPVRSRFRRQFAPVLLADVCNRAVKPLAMNLLRLRPRGFAALKAFSEGFAEGLRHPIDRETLLYSQTQPEPQLAMAGR